MSKLYDVQESLKMALETLPELASCAVIVDRQKELDSEARKSIAKAGGFACIIGAPRAENDEPELPSPRLRLVLGLELAFKPIMSQHLSPNAPQALDVVEAVIRKVHYLDLERRAHMCRQFSFLSYQLVQDPEWLVYLIEVETIIQL